MKPTVTISLTNLLHMVVVGMEKERTMSDALSSLEKGRGKKKVY